MIYSARMTPRVLIGMLIAGQDLRDMMNAQSEAVAYLIQERRELELAEIRRHRDLIAQFSAALEHDDQEALRDVLAQAFSDLADHVARLEEHA